MSEIRTDGSGATHQRRILAAVFCAVGYIALYWAALQIAWPATGTPVAWLPAGLAAGVLLTSPRRAWPALIVLCAFGHTVGAALWSDATLRVTLASLLATLIAATCSALAMRTLHDRDVSLDEPRGALLLLFPALLLGAAAGALAFALLGAPGSGLNSFADAFGSWFAAAYFGMAIVLPVQLATLETIAARRFSLRAQAPGILLGLAFVWLVQQAFSRAPSEPPTAFEMPLAALPILLWIFLEFDLLLLALCCAALGLYAAVGTANGLGPFATSAAPSVLPPLQWSVSFFSAGLLVLSAAFRSRAAPSREAPTSAGSRRAFIADSVESFWYVDIVPPLPVALPPEEQVERLLDSARFGSAEPGTGELHRTLGTTARDIAGLTLREFGERLAVDVRPGLLKFVSAGYRLRDYQWRIGVGRREGHAISSTCRGEVRDGLLRSAWGADVDVTGQHDAETALRYSEERFYRTFKNTSDAVVMVSMSDGAVVNVNAGFETLSGFARADVAGRDPREFLRMESPRSRRRLLLELRAHGIVRDHEIRFRDRHDRAITCLVSAEVVDLGGSPCLVAIGHDITQQREAEAALQRSERRFSMAFRNSPDAILLTDMESGKIVEINEGFERMTGLKRDEALGRTVSELGGWSKPRDRDQMFEILRRDGRVEQFEVESPFPSGEGRTLSVSAECCEVEDCELLIVTARDISESRSAARTLELYQQRLKSLASQLTLAEERVRRRIAVELHDGLSQELAATIMQLTAMRGTLDEAAQRRLSDSIDVLNQSMTSARSMVNRLSRQQLYESGLADALQALAADTASQEAFDCVFADRRGVGDLRCDCAESVRILLYRSVDELLRNAARYANARRVELTLDQDADRLVVTVADDGVGFDARALDTSGWTGTGFGLFSIRQQLESLGGEFTLSSSPGQGTSVTLSAPLGGDREKQERLSA